MIILVALSYKQVLVLRANLFMVLRANPFMALRSNPVTVLRVNPYMVHRKGGKSNVIKGSKTLTGMHTTIPFLPEPKILKASPRHSNLPLPGTSSPVPST